MGLGPPERKIMYIGDATPNEGDAKYCGWIDTATNTGKVYENGQWVVKIDFNTKGYTGEIKHGNDTMVFENGVLVKYG